MPIYNQQQLVSASNAVYTTNAANAITAQQVRDLNSSWVSSSALISGSNNFTGNQVVTGSWTQSGSFTSLGPNTFVGNTSVTGSFIVSGSLTMTNRPAFRIVGSGGAIYATATAGGAIISGSALVVDYNQGGYFNPSTGIFTAPITGLYQVNLSMRTFSNTNATINQAIVWKSGSATSGNQSQIMIEFGVNTSMNHAGASTISSLQAGDTLKAAIAVGTASFDGNDNFSVAYIG